MTIAEDGLKPRRGTHLNLLFDTLERMQRGAVLLDQDLQIIAINTEGERLLETLGGATNISNRFELPDPLVQNEFLRARSSALTGATFQDEAEFMIDREDELLRPIHAEVIVYEGPVGERPMLLVVLSDLESDWSLTISRAAKLFKLTDREKAVVGRLTGVQTEQQIAENLEISLNTLRTHRKNIYAKMHVGSRLELAMLLTKLT